MPYEPSKELIEHVAKEYWKASRPEQDWEVGGDVEKEFIAVAKEMLSCPTICKALEQYENQPKWQDKPDKEGWWWVCSEEPASGAKFNQIVEIRGIPAGLRVWVGGFPTIEQYIGEYVRGTKITWLYIPEPEPYKSGNYSE